MNNFKKKLTAFSAMLAFLSFSTTASYALVDASISGQTDNMDIVNNGSTTNVNLGSGTAGAVGQVDWNTLNVGKGETLNFGFSNISQTIINRVLGGQASEIMGKLTNSCLGSSSCTSYTQTSKVILINPAGVIFGGGSTVDLNSFTVSTFDFNGAKNLKGLDKEALKNYQNDLKGLSPIAGYNGTDVNTGYIKFDSNYTTAFNEAGLNITYGKDVDGNDVTFVTKTGTLPEGGTVVSDPVIAKIVLDGTTFAHFDSAGNMQEAANPNKSIAIVGDHIQYKDSLLRTGENYNYLTSNNAQSMSNVKLITADGVTFGYLANGYINSTKYAADTKNIARTIEVNNEKYANGSTVGIQSGNVSIANISNSKEADIKIKNTIVKGTKLLNRANGDIMIINTSGDVTVENSRLESVNTSANRTLTDGSTVRLNTNANNGGEVYISAGRNVKVKDSLIKSAGSKGANVQDDTESGSVRIFAYGGNADVENTKILAQGDTKVVATGTANVSGSLIQSRNTTDETKIKNIKISAAGGVNVTDSIVDAAGNVDVRSEYSDNSVAGNINITGTAAGKTLVNGKNVTLQGANTKLDNATLAYNTIAFHDAGTTGINNVTVANDSVFIPAGTTDITLETNGNFNLENATMKTGSASLTFERTDGVLDDDGTIGAIRYTFSQTPATAANISITSSEGDVNVVKGSNVIASNDINLTSAKGNVLIGGSSMEAGNDFNVIAANDVNVLADYNYSRDAISGNPSAIKAGKNVTLTATNNNLKVANSTVKAEGNATLTAGKNATVTGSDNMVDDEGNFYGVYANGNINITAGADTTVNNYATLNSGEAVTVTAGANFLADAATIDAGKNIDVTATAGDVKILNDSTVGSSAGNINLTANKDVHIKGNAIETSILTPNDINITAQTGELKVAKSSIGGDNVNFTSYKTIKFGDNETTDNILNDAEIIAKSNMKFLANGVNEDGSNADIIAEKTTMPSLQYGQRLEFNAKGSNNFTSADSLKSVNVDYIAGVSNNFDTTGDIQFVNSTFKSAANNIDSDANVILNNLTINVPDTVAAAKDVVTTINAKGDITTKDVTKTLAMHTTESTHSFPLSVETKADGTEETSVLDLNSTKFKATTSVDKDSANPTLGSITLDVRNASNKEAGLELVAENTVYDNDEAANQGPEVHLNAVDNQLAISKIVTDKLFLDGADQMFAASVELTPDEMANLPEGTAQQGYIKVKDYMGFNLDDDFTKDPTHFAYDENKHFLEGKRPTIDGGEIDIYKEHLVKFNNNTTDEFILVYDRPVGGCPEMPDVPLDVFDPGSVDDEIGNIMGDLNMPDEPGVVKPVTPPSAGGDGDNTEEEVTKDLNAAGSTTEPSKDLELSKKDELEEEEA